MTIDIEINNYYKLKKKYYSKYNSVKNKIIKSDASNIRGEIVRFNIASGDLKVD